MRFYEKSQLKISEDLLTDPKKIKFADDFEDTDAVLLKEIVSRFESFPIGTTAISLGNIATPKLLIIKPKNDVVIVLDGNNYTVRGGKLSKIWISFASLSLTISTAANEISLVVAGE